MKNVILTCAILATIILAGWAMISLSGFMKPLVAIAVAYFATVIIERYLDRIVETH